MKQSLNHYDEMLHLHNGTAVELGPQTTSPGIGDPISPVALNSQPLLPSCANCNAEIPERAGFCDNCGMPISEMTLPQEASPQEAPTQQAPEPSLTPPPQSSSSLLPPVEQPISHQPSSQEAPPPLAACEDDKPLWRRHWIPILYLLLLLLALLLGGTAYALIRATSEDVAVVPDLVGASSLSEAQRMAGENFEVVEDARVESEEPIGTVLSQDPAPGEETAAEGSTISVEVSKGANLPNVRGQTRQEALRVLEEAGFQVEEETEESSARDEGYVTDQDPRGGKREFAQAGTSVTITVGEGPDKQPAEEAESPTPKQEAAVPEVVRKDVQEAEPTPEKAKNPAPPKEVSVPDVVGKNVEEAKRTIQNAGFASTVETVQSDRPSGTVVSTDPAPGTLLDPSSRKVIIRQSSGPYENAKGPDVVDKKVEAPEPESPPSPPDTKAEESKPEPPPPPPDTKTDDQGKENG